MPMATWAATSLCTVSDVRDEMHSIESLVRYAVDSAEQDDDLIIRAIAKTKDRIRQKLLVEVRRRFEEAGYPVTRYPSGFDASLRSPDDMETALDHIENPEELKYYAVVRAIQWLLFHGDLVRLITSDESETDRLRKHLDAEETARWQDASTLLRFDFGADGQSDVSERWSTAKRFRRV